jgi:hypothetical protein
LGVSSKTPTEQLESAVRERWPVKDGHIGAIMKRCDVARIDPYLQGGEALHLVQELDEYATRIKLFQGSRKEKFE